MTAERSGRADVAIVGGGHNGLVCAAYLARAGRRVLVLEAADAPGGMAGEREIAPGVRAPAAAHLCHLLHPRVARELALERHGLAWAAADLPTVALGPEGTHLAFRRGEVLEGSAPLAPGEAAALAALEARLARFARALAPLLTALPPRLHAPDGADTRALAGLAWRLRRLGRADLREFLRVITMNVADLLEEELTTPLLQGALALDAVLGTSFGPRSPGTVFTLLYRRAGEVDGLQGAVALPRGGMGALTRALAEAARAAGAEIRTGSLVARILVEGDRAAGVELASGERIAAPVVVSNADPRTTLIDLLGPEHLDTGLLRRLRALRMRGLAARLDLVLDGLPEGPALDSRMLAGRLVIAPSIDAVERAFNHSKYRETSTEPVIEAVIPTLSDPTLAPEGRHLLTATVLYAPADVEGGWQAARGPYTERCIDVLEAHLPGLRERIIAAELTSPADLEARHRVAGGHWHHGDLALDQMLMLRPVPALSRYATPIPGLWLCGAGCHPGGGVSGVPGHNAARAILAGERP